MMPKRNRRGKLPFYCQPCQKQCHDKHGMECHSNTLSHVQQVLALLGDDPARAIENYSAMFEAEFMQLMRRAHPTMRVSGQAVYNEFISNPEHTRMTMTKWQTLSEFVEHLGRAGKCWVEKTPKAWYLQLVKTDSEEEEAAQRTAKRAREEKAERERQDAAIEEQIKRARKIPRVEEPETGDANLKLVDAAPVQMVLLQKARRPRVPQNALRAQPAARPGFIDNGDDKRPKTQMELLIEVEKAAKREKEQRATAREKPSKPAAQGRTDNPWLQTGIVVKVVSVASNMRRYYKQKGVVNGIIKEFVGEIEMLDSGDLLQVDQTHLQTVIPRIGGSVLVLKGEHAGSRAEMLQLGEGTAKFLGNIRLKGGREIWLDYGAFSKLA